MASIAIVAPIFLPYRSSGAVQLSDLSKEFVRQGHEVTVFVPSHEIQQAFDLELLDGVRVVKLRAPQSRDVFYLRRAISEFLTPYFMLRNLKISKINPTCFDGIVWYSPSIFLTPFARHLKSESRCSAYLIVRDIFPEWALNLELLSKGISYYFLKWIERSQYMVADTIGVQTNGNLSYFKQNYPRLTCSVEVLHNWLSPLSVKSCSISLKSTHLAGRRIVVYAGNMGVAQNLEIFIRLVARFMSRDDVGFLFVGRGSDKARLQELSRQLGLTNILFYDEVEPEEIADLYRQCDVGILALDKRHKTHNVPGKFISYMAAGLPVLALVNPGNDLLELISEEYVGVATSNYNLDSLCGELARLLNGLSEVNFKANCKQLTERLYLPEAAVRQIETSLLGERMLK